MKTAFASDRVSSSSSSNVFFQIFVKLLRFCFCTLSHSLSLSFFLDLFLPLSLTLSLSLSLFLSTFCNFFSTQIEFLAECDKLNPSAYHHSGPELLGRARPNLGQCWGRLSDDTWPTLPRGKNCPEPSQVSFFYFLLHLRR